jgi:hypothetical protein
MKLLLAAVLSLGLLTIAPPAEAANLCSTRPWAGKWQCMKPTIRPNAWQIRTGR